MYNYLLSFREDGFDSCDIEIWLSHKEQFTSDQFKNMVQECFRDALDTAVERNVEGRKNVLKRMEDASVDLNYTEQLKTLAKGEHSIYAIDVWSDVKAMLLVDYGFIEMPFVQVEIDKYTQIGVAPKL